MSRDWSVQIEEFLKGGEPVEASRATTRLPKAMVDAKADAYIPQIVSLGPYHQQTLKDVSVGLTQNGLTQMEMYKLRSAREAVGGKVAVIERLFTQVTEEPLIKKVEDFYDWSIGDDNGGRQNFGWMMTMDAFFLFQFLKNCFNDDHYMPSVHCVRCDILKLENQIPLFLLLKVKDVVSAELQPQTRAEPLEQQPQTRAEPFDLQSRIKRLSTFLIRDVDTPNLEKEEHLLGCIHTYVSSFLQIAEKYTAELSCWQRMSSKMDIVTAVGGICFRHPAREGQQDFLSRYNAEELFKAGISFKPFAEDGSRKIRFDKNSRTLYLPQIEVVDTYTEVMLRNLLALEFNEGKPEKAVTQYVELMDCLIDTPEDVTLLRHCGVIVRRSMMITDDYVAKMWDGMCKPFFAGAMEPPPALKSQIQDVLRDNFYKSKIRTVWKEFREQYFARPWQVVALLVGIFLVIIDTLQTYCSFKDCQTMFNRGGKSPPTKRSSMAFSHFG